MFSIRNFRNLIPYQKVLNISKEILKEDLTVKEKEELTFITIKVAGYIGKSEGSALYLEDRKKSFKKAVKWTNILDKKIKQLDLDDLTKRKYIKQISQIRRILISFKNKLEDNK